MLQRRNNGKTETTAIGVFVRKAFFMWGLTGVGGMVFLVQAGLRLRKANERRKRYQRSLGTELPTVLVLSVTMACNYHCQGCYSRGRLENDEMSTSELDELFTEAEELGFFAVILTGGEPLLCSDLLEVIGRHQGLLFVLITNGFLLTSEKARFMGNSRNLVVLVSIEGSQEQTDARRGQGAYFTALQAMHHLKKARVLFGFSATNTALNSCYLSDEAFIDEMIEQGCLAGLITEYVPCGPAPKPAWILEKKEREKFRERILHLRRKKSIVLIQFPQDEYGEANICSGAGRASLHINSQGGIEPCPFVPISRESIRRGGLMAAIHSPFLQAIRNEPRLLSRAKLACSLFEHIDEIQALANHLPGKK